MPDKKSRFIDWNGKTCLNCGKDSLPGKLFCSECAAGTDVAAQPVTTTVKEKILTVDGMQNGNRGYVNVKGIFMDDNCDIWILKSSIVNSTQDEYYGIFIRKTFFGKIIVDIDSFHPENLPPLPQNLTDFSDLIRANPEEAGHYPF